MKSLLLFRIKRRPIKRMTVPFFKHSPSWLNIFASSMIKMDGVTYRPFQRDQIERELAIFWNNPVISLAVISEACGLYVNSKIANMASTLALNCMFLEILISGSFVVHKMCKLVRSWVVQFVGVHYGSRQTEDCNYPIHYLADQRGFSTAGRS